MPMILGIKQRKALWEVVAMGQYDGITRPTMAERKAARAAYRVLDQHGLTKRPPDA